MGISRVRKYGFDIITVDLDFVAEASKDVIITLTKPVTQEVLRGRLYIDEDPGAGFASWATCTFYNKAAKRGEDAFWRTASKLVYTELEIATTGSDADIIPDDQTDFSPNDLAIFLDDDEVVRLMTIANTMVAENNVGAHIIDTGLSRVAEFSGFSLFNNEGLTDVQLRIAFAVAQTVSLKMELLVRI